MVNKQLPKLVKQLQNGNMQVFDEIYLSTKDVVFYSIINILKDYSISEDIMQETYLKALEKIHSYKPRHSFLSWIVTIAKNMALNEYNKRKREFKIDPSTHEYVFGTTESNIEKEMIVKELLDILQDEEREIVILHVLGNMKHKEIASLLSKPLGTITWKFNEAINKLRKQTERW